MRPIELRFNGINSYSVEQKVNFELLTKHQVFGIVGKTGSGKTTILDCIILALYGKVPRDDSATPKNFINSEVNECFVEFKFSGISNKILKTYIVTRAYKLSKDGQLKIHKCNLVEILDGNETVICSDKVKELNQIVEDIVGLKYEYFTKAVILPQGKFSEFLTLKNKDKGEMLEQIFSLEKYGDALSFKFNREKNETANKIKTINSNIEAIGVFDNVDELEKTVKESKEKKEKVSSDIKKINDELIIDSEILKLLNQLEVNKDKEKSLLMESESIEQLGKDIEKYKSANAIEKNIANKDKLNRELSELLKEEKIILEGQNDNEEKIKVFEKESLVFATEKEERYEKLVSEIALAQNLVNEQKTIADDEKNIVETRQKYKAKKEEENRLIDEEKTLKERLIVIEEKEKQGLSVQKENTISFDKIEVLNKGVNLETELSNILKNIEKIKTDIEKSQKSEKKTLEELESENKALETLKNVKEKQSENKKLYYSSLLKKELKVGDICPVCNEEISSLTHIDSINKEFDDSIDEEIKKIEMTIYGLNKNISLVKEELVKKKEELDIEIAKSEQASNDIQKLKVDNSIENFLEEKKHIEVKSKLLEKAQNELIQLSDEKKNISEKKEANGKATNEVAKEIASLIEQGNNLKNKIDIVKDKINKFTYGKRLEEVVEALSKERDYFVNKEKEFKEKREVLENRRNKFVLDKTSNELNIKNTKNQLVSVEENIKDDIDRFGFVDEVDVKQYCVSIEEIEKYTNKIKAFNDSLLVTKNNILKLTEELTMLKQDFVSIELESFRQTVNEKTIIYENMIKELAEIDRNIATNETKLEIVKKDLEKIKVLKKELKELISKLDYLEEITKLLSGRKFVQFIAKRYLDNICRSASIKLYEMSGRKYSLEADETDFVVVDHNRGNIKRQIKSISGGELFMVSLCLSLALSTYISKQNSGSIDMFFLDEGFGSLDDETLENVVDILFKASSSDLKIGLITHVTKLQENLPSKLYVREDIEKQSSIISMQ